MIKWYSEERKKFSSPQNKLLDVLITDNEIFSFAKLAEVVASSHFEGFFYWGYLQLGLFTIVSGH